jgi:glycosyltransferase involved in cell wall biosynthesis
MLSLVIPVYRNEENLDRLMRELTALAPRVPDSLEVVFVVDGSPDRSYERLQQSLPTAAFESRLLNLTRNFGQFAAVSAGLAAGRGDMFAVLSADLQEPPELVVQFADILRSGSADVVFGVRASRSDPWSSELTSSMFWRIYRRFVVPEMPPGGVDVFGCNREVRDKLLSLTEASTNLIALLFWVGYRRQFVAYHRQPRLEGVSAWTLSNKLRYCINSIFSFTDLPVRVLLGSGMIGAGFAAILGIVVFVSRVMGLVQVPGYAAIIITMVFFGGLTTFGLGIIGQYLWISLQNTRKRPNYIVWREQSFAAQPKSEAVAAGLQTRK